MVGRTARIPGQVSGDAPSQQNILQCWVWWHTLVTPETGKLRQQGHEFEAILDYIVRLLMMMMKILY